ncbi:hypothetical protein NG796_11890 [Laspinema sp. A4]|nr:hypothetical protein [Laspinema sp. D2d]MCT7984000.1 hypothetical protein [Laspinema sp. D2d]
MGHQPYPVYGIQEKNREAVSLAPHTINLSTDLPTPSTEAIGNTPQSLV